jgi:hypothetical protein
MKLVGRIACAILLIFAFALPAYAETQSVKVSGDITVWGVHRDNFDLNKNNNPDSDNFFITQAEVQIDADLTDNVSTVIRIVNQRNWGDSEYPAQKTTWVLGDHDIISWQNRLLDLGIDLAYIQIKEMFFEPVTLRIGRQDIWFGRGLIIGLNQVDPGLINQMQLGVVFPVQETGSGRRGMGSPELTAFNAFDAVRMTLDFEKYAPVVVDLVYAKLDEGLIGPEEDRDLYGVNVGYTWDVYNAETEAYYWLLHDNSVGNDRIGDGDQTHTIGVRGSFMPTEDFIFGGEAAVQYGHYIADQWQASERNREAYMLNLFGEYLGWTDVMFSPKVGAEWVYTTGDHDISQQGGEYSGWNSMFRGHFPMMIRPFLGAYYITSRFPGGEDFGLSNLHEFMLTGSIQPLDDVKFEAKIAKYYFDQIPIRVGEFQAKGDHDSGTELDLVTTYDYTEDVTFQLLTAWFWPGDIYESNLPNHFYPYDDPDPRADLEDTVATEVLGSCKVSF